MAQVTVRINGYAYTVGCEDGQEPHLQAMAEEVDHRVDSIKALGGQSGEARLLALAALLMADELHDLQPRFRPACRQLGPAERPARRRLRAEKLARLAERAEAIATELEARLDWGGGAARCVRYFIPGASKHTPGSWLCRDPGHGIWRPPAQQALGG